MYLSELIKKSQALIFYEQVLCIRSWFGIISFRHFTCMHQIKLHCYSGELFGVEEYNLWLTCVAQTYAYLVK